MIADPNNSGTYYSGGDYSNGSAYVMAVSKTTNTGGAWTRNIIGAAVGRTYALAMDVSNSNIVYAGGDEGGAATIYKTTNGGTSWNKLTASGLAGTVVYDIAIDPDNPNTVYAGTSTNCYKSTDGGGTWVSTGCPGGQTNAVLVNRGSVIYEGVYAGTNSNGVYYSTNGGSTWSQINEGLDDLQVNCLSVSQSNYLYAGTEDAGIYRWSIAVGVKEEETLPDKNSLFFALPNPMSVTTALTYHVVRSANVDLTIYDIQGRVVRVLTSGIQPAGQHTATWNGNNVHEQAVPAGVYFCRLVTEDVSQTCKIIKLE